MAEIGLTKGIHARIYKIDLVILKKIWKIIYDVNLVPNANKPLKRQTPICSNCKITPIHSNLNAYRCIKKKKGKRGWIKT